VVELRAEDQVSYSFGDAQNKEGPERALTMARVFSSVEEYVASVGGQRAIKKVLIANNGEYVIRNCGWYSLSWFVVFWSFRFSVKDFQLATFF